nr:hypothetical protein [Streptomyces sp. DSM 41633]
MGALRDRSGPHWATDRSTGCGFRNLVRAPETVIQYDLAGYMAHRTVPLTKFRRNAVDIDASGK